MATTSKGTPYVETTDLVSGYPAVSLSLANFIDNNKLDTAPTQNTQTVDYNFALADATGGKTVVANKATAIAFTILQQSSITLTDKSVLRWMNKNDGVLTITAGAGVTFIGSTLTFAKGTGGMAVRTASNEWVVLPFSAGSARATYSGTTGSPSVDTSSRSPKTILDYTGSGSITIATAGLVECRVFGGGAGGGHYAGGGGGAGGHFESTLVWLDAGTHTVTVGGGGVGGTSASGFQYGRSGSASRVGSYMAAGGGGGAYVNREGHGGGSGGGSGVNTVAGGIGFAPQGNAGGTGSSSNFYGGGGGGAGAVGANGSGSVAGAGGAGVASSITGSSVTYCGGGGGGTDGGGTAGAGGSGGGGAGSTTTTGTAGTANTGGGGGGAGGTTAAGGAGGSGRVIIVIG
jgi:hypothetical protein